MGFFWGEALFYNLKSQKSELIDKKSQVKKKEMGGFSFVIFFFFIRKFRNKKREHLSKISYIHFIGANNKWNYKI